MLCGGIADGHRGAIGSDRVTDAGTQGALGACSFNRGTTSGTGSSKKHKSESPSWLHYLKSLSGLISAARSPRSLWKS
jgi:hypothetical protein